MSSMPAWPGGAGAALSLSFDNLGEAAELELGAIGPDDEIGSHFTATRVVPAVLDSLRARDLRATFFVEGLNAELYPDRLREIGAEGHELGYHAWRHEQWDALAVAEQEDNLERGVKALRDLGLEASGLRPPGGGLGQGGLDAIHSAGLRYCSPAGEGAGESEGVALLPFQWRHVDASCVLPPFASVREQMTGSRTPLEPSEFVAYLSEEVERLADEGGYMAIVLHLSMFDWLGEERLGVLLDRVAARRDVWVARCAEVAEHVLSEPEAFAGGTTLDPTSWTG